MIHGWTSIHTLESRAKDWLGNIPQTRVVVAPRWQSMSFSMNKWPMLDDVGWWPWGFPHQFILQTLKMTFLQQPEFFGSSHCSHICCNRFQHSSVRLWGDGGIISPGHPGATCPKDTLVGPACDRQVAHCQFFSKLLGKGTAGSWDGRVRRLGNSRFWKVASSFLFLMSFAN